MIDVEWSAAHPLDTARILARPTGPSPPACPFLADAGIVQALRDDQTVEGALAAVYQHLVPTVLAHLRRAGIDPDLADDAVQEAVIHLWRQRATLPEEQSLRAWLAVVAARRAVDAWRRGWHRHVPWDAERHAGVLIGEDPSEILIRRERRRHVRQLLASLDADEQMLVFLTYWRGWSQARVAASLRVSPAALNSWAFRVRRHLAASWLALEAGRGPAPRRRLSRRDTGR